MLAETLEAPTPTAVAHSPRFAAVLFDLDGTLIDSAPDLAAAADEMRTTRGMPALPFERYRGMCGAGARGMIGVAFGIKPDAPCFATLKEEFFQRYERRMTQLTHAFKGVPEMLQAIEARELPWGVVTNKSERFAVPLSRQMPLLVNADVVIAGDTTPHAKPHPAPLLEAARRLGVAPTECVYIGDDERDIQAGKAAGMATAAVAWGYLGKNADLTHWGADRIFDSPQALSAWLLD
jgi:N-acetyl-D-muramate 6-phosphate phosphatase